MSHNSDSMRALILTHLGELRDEHPGHWWSAEALFAWMIRARDVAAEDTQQFEACLDALVQQEQVQSTVGVHAIIKYRLA